MMVFENEKEFLYLLLHPSTTGIYVGEYQKQAWVFVGEITNLHVDSLNGKYLNIENCQN